jgi:hypothetical protein
MAEWARGQEPGTELPDDAFFAADLDIVAGAGPWIRAKNLLAQAGVLDMNDGPYQVA